MKSALKLLLILTLFICLTRGIDTYSKYYAGLPACDYCHEKIWDKHFEVGIEGSSARFKICDRCWSILDYEAGKVFGNEYSRTREKWISEFLIDRVYSQ